MAGRRGTEKRYEDAIVDHLKAGKSTPKYLTEWMVTKYKKGDRGLRDLHRRQDSPTNRVTALRVAIRLMAEEVEAGDDSLEEDLDKQKKDLASRATLKQLRAASDLNEDASDDDSSIKHPQLQPESTRCVAAPSALRQEQRLQDQHEEEKGDCLLIEGTHIIISEVIVRAI